MNEHTPYFSVIIPVYNAEQYLRECVDSVLTQSFTDIEIILADDGSPDGSGAICDEYEKQDARVRVIHKPNGGPSDARNVGIRMAAGEYLMFLDSDDYWDDPDALLKLRTDLEASDKTVDIGIFQAKLLYPDGSMQPDRGVFDAAFNRMEPEESLRYLSENGLLVGSACSKAVRRSFLLEHGLFFDVRHRGHEDIDWILRVADRLPQYAYSDQFFYIYRKGQAASVSSNMSIPYLNAFADMLEGFSSHDWSTDTVRECLLGYVAYEFSILMAKAVNLPASPGRSRLISRICSMGHLLDHDIHPKVRRVNLARRFLGLRGTMLLLGFYLKYRNR